MINTTFSYQIVDKTKNRTIINTPIAWTNDKIVT